MPRMIRCLALVISLALFAAACGDDDESSAADSVPTETTDGDTPTEPSGPAAAPSGAGDTGSGFIRIGDETHELTIGSCVSMFGILGGDGQGVDHEDLYLTFDFSPEDWQDRPATEGWEGAGSIQLGSDDPYVQWETGDELRWLNLEGVDVDELVISSFTIDERSQSVRGEATFIDLAAHFDPSRDAEPTAATFEFNCP